MRKAITLGAIRTPTLLLLVLIMPFSCEQEKRDFYRDTMQAHDVWRLPLIEPYQLITAYCCEGWNCGPGSSLDRDFGFAHSADSINIENGYILIHTEDSGSSWFALDLSTKKKFELEDRQALSAFTAENGFHLTLYATRMVFEK